MKIALGADHKGYALKEDIRIFLTKLGHEVLDFGTDSSNQLTILTMVCE